MSQVETPDGGIGYLHKAYEKVEVHSAGSHWQECLCRSCQDVREIKGYPWGTSFRLKDERY
jgi:hypothetical protein